jgi:hypothetical protein
MENVNTLSPLTQIWAKIALKHLIKEQYEARHMIYESVRSLARTHVSEMIKAVREMEEISK